MIIIGNRQDIGTEYPQEWWFSRPVNFILSSLYKVVIMFFITFRSLVCFLSFGRDYYCRFFIRISCMQRIIAIVWRTSLYFTLSELALNHLRFVGCAGVKKENKRLEKIKSTKIILWHSLNRMFLFRYLTKF